MQGAPLIVALWVAVEMCVLRIYYFESVCFDPFYTVVIYQLPSPYPLESDTQSPFVVLLNEFGGMKCITCWGSDG